MFYYFFMTYKRFLSSKNCIFEKIFLPRQYTFFMGLLKTIFIILLVYYGVKFLSRLFAPVLMRFVAKKAEQRFGQQFNQHKSQQEPQQKEGEISIEKTPKQSKASNKDVGEYVDYEEID